MPFGGDAVDAAEAFGVGATRTDEILVHLPGHGNQRVVGRHLSAVKAGQAQREFGAQLGQRNQRMFRSGVHDRSAAFRALDRIRKPDPFQGAGEVGPEVVGVLAADAQAQ